MPDGTADRTDWAERTLLVSRLAFSDTRSGEAEKTWYLRLVEGSEPGLRLALSAQPLAVGRADPADIVLSDSEVSRRHCSVQILGGEVIVTDLGSTNGTFIDGVRVETSARLEAGGILQVGRQVLKCEHMSRREAEQADEFARDLLKASQYVQALLPAPLIAGPVRTDWFFLPSSTLGGDAFGYQQIAPGRYAFYLIGVSAHGAGAAMHSVTVINVLRQQALPAADFRRPSEVAAALNAMFQADTYGGMYFSLWYGVYDTATRQLAYCSAGHHPAYLVPHDRRQAIALKTANAVVGVSSGTSFVEEVVTVPPGAMIYLFSDGVFEITATDGRRWGLQDLVPLILGPTLPDAVEPQRIYRAVRSAARDERLDDDFSLLVVSIP